MRQEHELISNLIENYNLKKIEVDFYIQTKGIIFVLDTIDFLIKNKTKVLFENIILVEKCDKMIKRLCFDYLIYLENYLKEIVFIQDTYISIGELKKISLNQLFNLMIESEEYNFLLKEIKIIDILNLRTKIFKNSFMIKKDVFVALNELKKLLPEIYKTKLTNSLKKLSKKYNFIDVICYIKE